MIIKLNLKKNIVDNKKNIIKKTIFDHRDEVLNTTYKFIEESINQGDSVLVHSVKGHNRSVCIVSAYMMRK